MYTEQQLEKLISEVETEFTSHLAKKTSNLLNLKMAKRSQSLKKKRRSQKRRSQKAKKHLLQKRKLLLRVNISPKLLLPLLKLLQLIKLMPLLLLHRPLVAITIQKTWHIWKRCTCL